MQLKINNYNEQLHCSQIFKKSPILLQNKAQAYKWLFLEKTIPLFQNLIDSSPIQIEISSPTEIFDPLSWVWNQLIRDYSTLDNFYAALTQKQLEIREFKEKFRSFIEETLSSNPIYTDLCLLSFFENGAHQIGENSLIPTVNQGISGSYFLLDETGLPRFVIKPLDEDGGCLNNPQGFVTLLDSNPFRENIPLYRSSMREALAYQIALIAGTETIAPKTALAIFKAEQFYDVSGWVPSTEIDHYFSVCGSVDREKICSLQEFVPNAKTLFEAQQELQALGLSDEEIAARFDQNDFEDANLLIWCTYDTDAHMGNILTYPKGVDSLGNEILGLKKIDNGLAFPNKNEQLRNSLVYLPNGSLPLSDRAKEKIRNLNVDQMTAMYKSYGLESAIPALLERIPLLQEYAERPGITIKELNAYMAKIGNHSS